ncbi:MAG: acyl-CoA thioesterase [Deltaproteobacteria bacterium]|jgi:acyl-CoA thioester hydrolase
MSGASRAPRVSRTLRGDHRRLVSLETRWMDNDVYGHVNNVVYYSFFDTAINRYLIEYGGLDLHRGEVIGLCVASGCTYHEPVAYPDPLEAGLRVAHLGTSSVRYEVGIFLRGAERSVADGHFTHVFVAREGRRPVPIPEPMRSALARLAT